MAEVLSAPSPHDNHQYLPSGPLLRSSASQPSLLLGSRSPLSPPPSESNSPSRPDSFGSSESDLPPLHRSSSFSTGLSLNTFLSDEASQDEDEELTFPSYNGPEGLPDQYSPTDDRALGSDEPVSNAPTPEVDTPVEDADTAMNPVVDDIDARQEPSRQVDYLSHEWREEDIWSSWRHIVARRKVYGEKSRLENASWRTWTKQKYGLRTISPETLNWLKDCDVTWLYGPLQEAPRNRRNSEPSSCTAKGPPFLKKKPILKKRSVSEEMLQKSLSSSSLVKQAAAAVQAQRNNGARIQSRPSNRLRRCASDFDGTASTYTGSTGTADISSTLPSSTSSGLLSPDGQSKRRIRFDDKVEQCIAVDFKEGGHEEERNPSWMHACSDEDSDDDLPTIKTRSKSRSSPLSRANSSRNSFSSDSKGIVKLPSTKLKYHHEELDCRGHLGSNFKPLRSPALSPSASQETLKPAKESSSSRFLLGDQDDSETETSASSSFQNLRKDSVSGKRPDKSQLTREQDEDVQQENGMRRTPSGVFMPFEEGEDDGMASSGFFGRIADTVNTARDIAYVLYNVGWRK